MWTPDLSLTTVGMRTNSVEDVNVAAEVGEVCASIAEVRRKATPAIAQQAFKRYMRSLGLQWLAQYSVTHGGVCLNLQIIPYQRLSDSDGSNSVALGV
jgi:hypothetical protein